MVRDGARPNTVGITPAGRARVGVTALGPGRLLLATRH
jgi:hypothetical protein